MSPYSHNREGTVVTPQEYAKLMGELYGLKILAIVALGNVAKSHPNPGNFLTSIHNEALRGIATAEYQGLGPDQQIEYRTAAASVLGEAIDALKMTLSPMQR